MEKCSATLDRIHSVTQPHLRQTVGTTMPTPQQAQQYLMSLIAHLRGILGQCPPKDLESVALAITKIALTRFLTNPIFHAKTEDSALLALGCEVRCLLLFHAKFSRLSCCWYILRYWNSYFPTWLTFTSCTRFEIT